MERTTELSERLSTDRRSGSEIAKSRGAKAIGSLQSKDERPNSANALSPMYLVSSPSAILLHKTILS
ncbi:hypothetical protein [Leptospira santarosai]|uniref:hypothetical protein n=1 Tax=Leptospira santarosai TaxID=28183 RepID=UPI003D15F3E0